MMNSMKKFISVILALVMVLGVFSVVHAEGTGATTQAAKYAKEIEVIKAMGIINGDETGAFNADANLTRAEFAQVLTVLLKINNGDVAKENAWYYKFEIPEDLDNTILTPSTGLITGSSASSSAPAKAEKVQKFEDVPTSHWAFGVISQITDIGYMIGTSATEFSPEEPVTVNQVNKVLVKILGYEQFANINGGYPAGFNYIASTLKVLKGINNYGENPVTRGELAKMLYNMFDVNMISATVINDEGVATYETSEKTFLNDILGVYKYKGKVTDNGTTALLGSSTVEKDEIKIGNKTYKLSEDASYVKGLIGRVVEFYAVKDEDNDDEMVIYASVAKDSEEFTIEIDDFYNLTKGKLEYLDENEKKQYVDISTTPNIIFNGTKVENITKEEIKAFSNGTVTAFKSGESAIYDTLVIEGFVSVHVKNVISSDMVISNSLISQSANSEYKSIDLKPENNKTRTIVIVKDGMDAEFSDITKNSVLDVSLSKNQIKIIISGRKEKITVAGKTVDEYGESYIYTEDGKEYIIAEEFLSSSEVKVPDVGLSVTAYFNNFGEIAYFDSSARTLETVGILVNAISEGRGLKKADKVRVFMESGAFADYALAEKLSFTDEFGTVYRDTSAKIVEKLAAYKDKLVTLTVSDENIVTEIIMPLDISLNDKRENGRLGIFYSSGGDASYYSGGFSGKAFTTTNSPKLFYISTDSDVDEISKYQIRSSSTLMNDTKHSNVVAYNFDSKSAQAKYFVISSNALTNYRPSVRSTEFIIVQSVKNVLSIEGEPAVRISGLKLPAQSGKATPIEVESSTGAFNNMISYVGNTTNTERYSVKAGDVINVFEANGNVEYASLVYRQSLNYAKNPRKMGGAIAGQQSGLTDSTGKGNPLGISDSGLELKINGYTIRANEASGTNADIPTSATRLFDGFVIRNKDNLITFTNQDLSDPAQVLNTLDYAVNSYPVPANVTVVTFKGEKVDVAAGKPSDIKTYDDYGYKCSRILFHGYAGTLYKLIIFNVED